MYDDEDEYSESRALRNHAPVHEVPLDQWVPELVLRRLVDAARIIVATGGAVGPAGLDKGSGRGLNVTPRSMTLAEQASEWPSAYIPQEQMGIRRVLMLFLWCKAHRRKFGKEARQRGWSRTTAHRRREQALSLIAQGLDRDGVKVEV